MRTLLIYGTAAAETNGGCYSGGKTVDADRHRDDFKRVLVRLHRGVSGGLPLLLIADGVGFLFQSIRLRFTFPADGVSS